MKATFVQWTKQHHSIELDAGCCKRFENDFIESGIEIREDGSVWVLLPDYVPTDDYRIDDCEYCGKKFDIEVNIIGGR